MYEDYIETLKPNPFFNLKQYKENDLYSEGDIEDLIVEMIAKNEPEDYSKAICQNFSWSTYYHLTHIRKNILNWYPFDKTSENSGGDDRCKMGEMKNHHLITQTADIIMQICLSFSPLRKEIGQSIKNTSSWLLESFR